MQTTNTEMLPNLKKKQKKKGEIERKRNIFTHAVIGLLYHSKFINVSKSLVWMCC